MERRHQLWDVAEKLHRLIVCHDKAVQQMYLLDSKHRDLKYRLSLLSSSRFPRLKQHWSVRAGMVEWIRDMYDEYRIRKWTEIQVLINYIFVTYNSQDAMTVLVLADVTVQSIGVFIENEEEETRANTSDSDGSHSREMMLVEEDYNFPSVEMEDLNISEQEEEMGDTNQDQVTA